METSSCLLLLALVDWVFSRMQPSEFANFFLFDFRFYGLAMLLLAALDVLESLETNGPSLYALTLQDFR